MYMATIPKYKSDKKNEETEIISPEDEVAELRKTLR